MSKCIIIDFNRTLYDPDNDSLVDGAKDFLDKYRGHFKLALIGMDDRERAKALKKLGVDEYFDYVEFVKEKNEAEFTKCIKKLGCKAQMTWVIGDRACSEIRIGKKLGMNTIWLRRDKFENEYPKNEDDAPHFEVTSFLMAGKLIPLGLG